MLKSGVTNVSIHKGLPLPGRFEPFFKIDDIKQAAKDFPDIKAKYGRDIKLETFDEEEWTTIESLSPEIKVQDVMDEFGILTLKQHIARADRAQHKKRCR